MNVSTKEKPSKKGVVMPEENAPATEPQTAFEKAIILRATSMALGNIATNWEDVLAAVEEKSEQYRDISRYNGDENQAKNDLALLRKQKTMTKTTIASIVEAWNEPLKPFLTGGKAIEKQFDYAIEAIDTWVKEGKSREQEKKRQDIQAYFDGRDFDLVPLDLFFDNRWLNKGYKIQDIKKEIDARIAEIYGNIKILESITDHGMAAKAFYLETLDMGAAMRQVETLKTNAERLAREKVEREERERQAQIARNAAEERREEQQAEKEERVKSLADEALDLPEPEIPMAPPKPQLIEYTLRFRGTERQFLDLREYSTAHGIVYEKLDARFV